MIALPRSQCLADLMEQKEIGRDELVHSSGLDLRVIDAMIHQRYTPSPQQRQNVADVLGVTRDQVVWGHLNAVDESCHTPD